jgi:hypothetical protein
MNPNPPVDAHVLHFSIGYCWKDEDNFCRIRLVGGTDKHMGIEEVTGLCNAAYEICEGKPHKHLIDARGVYGSVLPGAREELRKNKKMNTCRSAAAIIVNSLANKLIMTFFIQFNKPPYPYRVFENPEDAKKWLNSL